MVFIRNLLFPVENCEEVVCCLCRELKVSITRTALVNGLVEHPDYPSLLSISDVLRNYGVKNISLKVDNVSKLIDLETPFIVQIKKEGIPLFALVYNVEVDKVRWRNPETKKIEIVSLLQFEQLFTGYVQIYEVTAEVGEKDYSLNLKKEKNRNLVNTIIAFAIPFITILFSVIALFSNGISALIFVIYSLLLLFGGITSTLLILYETDQYNPFFQKVCGGGGKTNCAAILHSKGSKIFGIEWSIIGFSYFIGVLLVLLGSGMNSLSLLEVAAWINILVLPYTVYSIYYQARIVKQWCPMCLTVQVILILLFLVSLLGNLFSVSVVSVEFLLPYGISIGSIFLLMYILFPIIKKGKTAKHYLQNLQKLKHNPQVFEALLLKEKRITESTEGLGLILGNPEGTIHIVKVCNPYCGPCAKAHPLLDELINNNPNISLQVIFTVTDENEDFRNRPVKNLLTLQNEEPLNLRKALDDWYLSEDKDYEAFNRLYPFEQEKLDRQLLQIKAMSEWCVKTDIQFTPTFFINGYQLPDLYSVGDLRYFLSV